MQRVSNYIYANNELSNKLKRAEPVSIKVNCKRALFKDESLRFHKRLNTGLWSYFLTIPKLLLSKNIMKIRKLIIQNFSRKCMELMRILRRKVHINFFVNNGSFN